MILDPDDLRSLIPDPEADELRSAAAKGDGSLFSVETRVNSPLEYMRS